MRERARRAMQQVDAEIHLQPGEALLHAAFQALAVNFRVVRFSGVGVAADVVAKLSAKHLIHGHAISLASEVPQRHLNTAHAAGLTRIAAELFDLAENIVDVAGVLAQEAALEE